MARGEQTEDANAHEPKEAIAAAKPEPELERKTDRRHHTEGARARANVKGGTPEADNDDDPAAAEGPTTVGGTVTPADSTPPTAAVAANSNTLEKDGNGAQGLKPSQGPDGEEKADAAETSGGQPEAPKPTLPPFNADAAKAALGAAANQASGCRKGDEPTGSAEVLITFAPSGRVTSANVSSGPFAGSSTGGCVASTLRRAKVPPFSGNHVTVRKVVTLR
jgi:hypothetical protein